jgi:ribosomal protein L10
MKRVRQTRIPELKVMGAIIENRVLLPENLQDISKLPTLDTLRAQIVGLLSAPAAQLAAILSEASGGKLARTLEGLKKGLEESSGAPSPDEASPP